MSADSPGGAAGKARQQPESFRARALGASLTVKDLQKSLAWYRDVIGFHVDRQMERDGKVATAALKAGGITILLNQDDGAKGWDRNKGQGFSLNFTTGQSVDQLADRIKSHGVTLEREPTDMPWGARLFTFRDPDGYKIAISSEA